MIVSTELIDRMVDAEIVNLIARVGPYRTREGNPSGIEIKSFGPATAFAAANIPVRLFNSVLGGGDAIIERLDEVEEFYRASSGEGAIELVPGRLSEEGGRELFARGYGVVEFHAGMARPLSPADLTRYRADPDVEVEEIDPSDAAVFERFLDIYLAGWGGKTTDEAKANPRCWVQNERWRFYVGSVDGKGAGAAILDIIDGAAVFASGSTMTEFRGRGVQAALISARIRDAAAAGCDLMVGGAYFATPSMRNQMRAGMQLGFTRAIATPMNR